jgi:formylglycine-generating enzyme required for sulfatase activity
MRLSRSIQAIGWVVGIQLHLCLVALILDPAAALAQQNAARIALVIGNASYPGSNTSLPSTINDARAVAGELRRLDFSVQLEENLGSEKMRRALSAFTASIGSGATGLIYFAGLGLKSVGESYLIPVDARISTVEDIWRECFSIEIILGDMDSKGAKTKIIIIDAARPNAFETRLRSSAGGLAPSVGTVGTLALYSASPHTVVKEAAAARSVFTAELVKHLRSPGVTAEEVFHRTRLAVSRASGGAQVPWVASSLAEDFYFLRSAAQVTTATEPSAAAAPAVREPVRTDMPQRGDSPQDKAEAFRDCGECPSLVVMPAGSFEMGSSASEREKPMHRVSFARPFAIGQFEVTFDEWDRCVEERGCKRRPSDRGWGRGNRPAINVSWLDAKEYVAWLGKKTGHVYRLPSEAEWEYAARAGTATPYWWGGSPGTRQANCRECKTESAEQTLPIGSFGANPFGLFDTAGNAAEWVEDCWNESYRGAPTNGAAWVKGDCKMRVLRGGSFDSQAAQVQSSARFRYDADVPYSANGFRVVRELQLAR